MSALPNDALVSGASVPGAATTGNAANGSKVRTAAMHTPGPWTARRWTCHAATTVTVEDTTIPAGRRTIADCESEDDARLIAAAPDLLDSAVEAAGCISACIEMLSRSGHATTAAKLREFHAQQLAVIVKATNPQGGAA